MLHLAVDILFPEMVKGIFKECFLIFDVFKNSRWQNIYYLNIFDKSIGGCFKGVEKLRSVKKCKKNWIFLGNVSYLCSHWIVYVN